MIDFRISKVKKNGDKRVIKERIANYIAFKIKYLTKVFDLFKENIFSFRILYCDIWIHVKNIRSSKHIFIYVK